MTKYHINPETGRANICRAVNNCAFSKNGESVEHYDSKEEAQNAFEKQNSQNNIHSVQKRILITPATKEEKEQKIDEMIDELSREEKQELLTLIVNSKRENKKKEFNKKLDQLMVNEKYYGTVFHHRGKVIEQGRMSKEEYHRLQEEKGKKRKLEREAENRAEEKEMRRRKELRVCNERRMRALEKLEDLFKKEEELKNDKKRVEEYIDLLNRKSVVASSLERNAINIRGLSEGEDRHSAHLMAEDAVMFEKKTYQNEYKELLEIRAEMRKRMKRNPFTAIKKTSADMRGVLIKEQSVIRSINHRVNEIISFSYIWRIKKEDKIEWKKFEKSIDHLLDDDEK